MIEICVFLLVAGLAAANGANDVSKGVATLVGSGVTRYRTAIAWGAVTTLAGSLLSGLFAEKMFKLFTSGIVTVEPSSGFTLAVAAGAAGWVAIATATKLPVSTTHGIIGALLGAGIASAPGSVAWASLPSKLAFPLLASIGVSYLLSATLNKVFPATATDADCVCVDLATLDAGPVQIGQPVVTVGNAEECTQAGKTTWLSARGVHWFSSGAVGFARGLNDTPKLAAIGAGILASRSNGWWLIAAISGAMFLGSLIAGGRVAKVLAENVVKMNDREGLLANLATSVLVGAGANLGLPMSTTHVSTGAITGIAGANGGRLNKRTLVELGLAWTVTPFVAGIIASLTYLAVR